MLNIIESSLDEFCSSSYFLLLDPGVKEHGLGILIEFFRQCKNLGMRFPDDFSIEKIEQILFAGMAKVDLPLQAKMGIPSLIATFFKYLGESGKLPQASIWEDWVNLLDVKYRQRLRTDGSIKGDTYKKNYTDVNRNDPCPCGSGKKFKKCCMNLI